MRRAGEGLDTDQRTFLTRFQGAGVSSSFGGARPKRDLSQEGGKRKYQPASYPPWSQKEGKSWHGLSPWLRIEKGEGVYQLLSQSLNTCPARKFKSWHGKRDRSHHEHRDHRTHRSLLFSSFLTPSPPPHPPNIGYDSGGQQGSRSVIIMGLRHLLLLALLVTLGCTHAQELTPQQVCIHAPAPLSARNDITPRCVGEGLVRICRDW